VHLRVSDNAGQVLLDTDPCAAPINDIVTQPKTPTSYLVDTSIGLSVLNPTEEMVSAIGTEEGGINSAQSVGLIVGITLGLIVFIVIMAGVVYFLLKRNGVGANNNDVFVTMPKDISS